jgi:hypothetical protein
MKVFFAVKPDEKKANFAWVTPVLQSRIAVNQEAGEPVVRSQVLECFVSADVFDVKTDSGQKGKVSETVITCGDKRFRVYGIEFTESR